MARKWLVPSRVGVANKIADSLGGGAALGMLGGPILYTLPAGTLATPTTTFLTAHKPAVDTVYVIGGAASVPESTLTALRSLWP